MRINIIGVPLDLGADRRGVDMGPSAIRYANITDRLRVLGHEVEDLGNIVVEGRETRLQGDPRLKYLDQIVQACGKLAERTYDSISSGALPLTLGGDHSAALGSVSGVANALGDVGVIWFDAHGDFNTAQTSPSGNIHGMILAALAGYGDHRLVNTAKITDKQAHVDPDRIAVVGARNLDPGEVLLLREAGVHVFPMSDIDRRGIYEVTHEALVVVSNGTKGFHVSFDMDVVDPSEAPGVGTPVHGGITYREAHMALELVAENGKLVGVDFVEVNPILDQANRTAILATELALSAMGKRTF
ncbi:MAG: arginase [Chloroflexi bacterium]|nr:MAG: arginase [Chloroflexota bacterium]